MAQFDAEHGGVKPIEPAIDAFKVMIVLFRPAVVREHPRLCRPCFVVRHQRTAIAIGAEVLARIETETCNVGEL